jgi:hypothetical protein
LGDRWGIEGTLTAYAAAIAALEGPQRAAILWGAAERLRDEIGAHMQPRERERYAQQVSAARSACRDESAFDSAWREGLTMTALQAFTLARSKSR